jgi:uncharacterized protein (TIGR00730 family)
LACGVKNKAGCSEAKKEIVVLNIGKSPEVIAVFGGRHPVEGDREYAEAVRLGILLANAGHTVMSGGYSGVMEAVSRGASEAGGTAIGVTMDIFGSLQPNRYLTREMRTRNFFERLDLLISSASAFLVLRGGMGTLTEISLIWNMLQTRTMPPKPVILIGDFWRPMLESVAGHLVISANELDLFHYAADVDDAFLRLQACLPMDRTT